MNENYLLNTIDALASTDVLGLVHIDKLKEAIFEDLKLALNELVKNEKLTFQRDVNGNPIFSING